MRSAFLSLLIVLACMSKPIRTTSSVVSVLAALHALEWDHSDREAVETAIGRELTLDTDYVNTKACEGDTYYHAVFERTTAWLRFTARLPGGTACVSTLTSGSMSQLVATRSEAEELRREVVLAIGAHGRVTSRDGREDFRWTRSDGRRVFNLYTAIDQEADGYRLFIRLLHS